MRAEEKKENICWPLIWRKGSLHLYRYYVVSMHCGHWSTGNTSSLDECSRKAVWGKCLGLFFHLFAFFFLSFSFNSALSLLFLCLLPDFPERPILFPFQRENEGEVWLPGFQAV